MSFFQYPELGFEPLEYEYSHITTRTGLMPFHSLDLGMAISLRECSQDSVIFRPLIFRSQHFYANKWYD